MDLYPTVPSKCGDPNDSLTPSAVDFPQQPTGAAFHGLAGDVVRRVEPHTEADATAVLVQTLAVFGSAIGRNAFATVESSRHYGNTFAVLVGESSKARKGTSLNHVLRIFERIDEAWRKDCTVTGLSSGEGLIWSVRDEIKETKPVKDKGKYTDDFVIVTVDQGVTDKRLCVQEGEFANVLKVMGREGNTLSPVIRQAWDSGNLRSLTKNFPAQATDAHITIIGHITRDELRRLLTETESANGFANRFLWIAVRRSKCLPEGGNIGEENLNDLVIRLHKAIDFARAVGEVKRSDSAKKLWAAVYPDLSEGKPGLIGAITARAEAQVLRLSVLYALLDCSHTVEPEHLRAALALWSYCERSACWIFGTATGDANADKVLAALQAAGGAGLTQTEILENVCQRNLSSEELTRVLQALERSGQARCEKESTATKPRKRWFYHLQGYECSDPAVLASVADTGNNSYNSFASGTEKANPKPEDWWDKPSDEWTDQDREDAINFNLSKTVWPGGPSCGSTDGILGERGGLLRFKSLKKFQDGYNGQCPCEPVCAGLENSPQRKDLEACLDTLKCGRSLEGEPYFYYDPVLNICRCYDCQGAEWAWQGFDVDNGFPWGDWNATVAERRVEQRCLILGEPFPPKVRAKALTQIEANEVMKRFGVKDVNAAIVI